MRCSIVFSHEPGLYEACQRGSAAPVSRPRITRLAFNRLNPPKWIKADFPAPLALDELGEINAEGAITNVVTGQNLNATNSGNTINADTVKNGDISFSGNALTGFNGVGNFVTNTGNNNNLQGTISVTITGTPLSQ